MPSMFSSKGSSTSNSSSTSTPWTPQATAVQNAFNWAGQDYHQAAAAPPPSNFIAQTNPGQLNTYGSMQSYGMNNATPQTTAAVGGGLANSGLGATEGALTHLGAFNAANGNNPQTLIDNANAYASGADVPAMVRAAMQPAMEQVRDVTLPGMESSAAGNGNINSSRTALAEGLVQRGLGETAANMAGNLRSQLYTSGLSTAENQAVANNQQNLGALTAAGTIGNSATANGVSDLGQSITQQGALYDIANAGGQGFTNADQRNLSNQLEQWQHQTNDPFAALNNYWNIVGSRNWGENRTGTETKSSTETPSAMSSIGSMLGMFGSLF